MTCIVFEMLWQDIEIEVSYQAEKFADWDHLELRSIKPVKAPLPVTPTGYRSRFFPAGSIDPTGDFQETLKTEVTHWLDMKASEPGWIEQREAGRQGELF
ncbi:MAG: hypothetical protein ACQRW7_06535 [Caulobacterales bacterium]|uniref:hypothetical protein n=1 Tax=Glycocaulis sp. TaxID=1969725 RepID=UPI003FA107DA